MNKINFNMLKKRCSEKNRTIQRSDLHEALYRAVDPTYVHFNKKVEHFKQTNQEVTLHFTDGTEVSVDYVIAADGIHSIFRKTLMTKSKPRYAGYTCWRGITKNKDDVSMYLSSEVWSTYG